MAGRPGKPVQLIKLEGNKDRRTKAELEYREKFEKSLYTGMTFKESPAVKADPVAHKEFLRLKKLYKNIQYAQGLNDHLINCDFFIVRQVTSKTEIFVVRKNPSDLVLTLGLPRSID